MSNSQLWQQCQNLTHHSLEAFLLSIIERPNVYNLYQFLQHPQIATVEEKILNFYKLFITQTFQSFPQTQLKSLSQKKINKLKKLTLLKLFQGLTEISLNQIYEAIFVKKQQAIDMLLEMSIASTIDIKINEKQSKVEVHYAQIPGRSFSHQDTKCIEGKISQIINKNNRILNIIDEAYSQIKSNREQQSTQFKKQSSYHDERE